MRHNRRKYSVGVVAVAAALAVGEAAAQPVNDACGGATEITFSSLPYVAPPVATAGAARGSEADACAWFGYTVWYKLTPTSDAEVIFETCAERLAAITLPDTVLSLYSSSDGTCDRLTLEDCNDDTCGFRSRVAHQLAAGTTYFVQVGQYRQYFQSPGPVSPEDVLSLSVRITDAPTAGQWTEVGETGELPSSAQVVEGSPLTGIVGVLDDGDSDMYRLDICDATAFTASTVGGALFDTQLFLFNSIGQGVLFNDDEGGTLGKQSRLTSTAQLQPGGYFLAVSAFDRDPLDSALNQMWLDTPYRSVRGPDGPGAQHKVSAWSLENGNGGGYTIALSGCAPAGVCSVLCPPCIADFDNNGGVDGNDIAAFFPAWEVSDPCTDVNLDGGVDGRDVETFFVAWEAGGC